MSVQTTYSDAPVAGVAGQAIGKVETYPMRNAEASAEIAFGRAVVFKDSADTDQDAVLPSAETDAVAGIVLKQDVYDRTYTLADGSEAGELGSTGLKPGAMMSVAVKGMMWAVCEDGCSPGDRLWIRAVAGGDPEFLGGLNNADDSTDMIDATACGRWLTTASAGGLAKLEFDFTNA